MLVQARHVQLGNTCVIGKPGCVGEKITSPLAFQLQGFTQYFFCKDQTDVSSIQRTKVQYTITGNWKKLKASNLPQQESLFNLLFTARITLLFTGCVHSYNFPQKQGRIYRKPRGGGPSSFSVLLYCRPGFEHFEHPPPTSSLFGISGLPPRQSSVYGPAPKHQ